MTLTQLKTSDISLIIPALNEEENLQGLAENLDGIDSEVLFVDGGSTDCTAKLAQSCGFTVIESQPGRALQMNKGASLAKGKVLLFLHADTRLPKSFSPQVVETVSRTDIAAGAFKLSIEGATPAMKCIAVCANIRSAYHQLPYGDQAIFLLKETFFKLGKFPLMPIMEDYVLMKKARKLGKIHVLDDYAITSARRWQKRGVVRTTLINQLVILGYHFNVSPEKLALLYRR